MPLLGSIRLDDTCHIYIGKCSECRGRFSYTKYHRYVRQDGKKQLIYCSYTCFRKRAKEFEAKEREKFDKKCKQVELRDARSIEYLNRRRALKRMGEEYCSLEALEEQIAYTKGKIDEYGRKFLESEPGSADRYYARRNLARWEKELIRLRELAEKNNTGGEQNVHQEPRIHEGHEQS